MMKAYWVAVSVLTPFLFLWHPAHAMNTMHRRKDKEMNVKFHAMHVSSVWIAL